LRRLNTISVPAISAQSAAMFAESNVCTAGQSAFGDMPVIARMIAHASGTDWARKNTHVTTTNTNVIAQAIAGGRL